MKIERRTSDKVFVPFNIVVESIEEAHFLAGLFKVSSTTKKEDAYGYCWNTDCQFYNAIEEELQRQGVCIVKTTKEKVFTPVTITLDTQAEVDVLWILLNTPSIKADELSKYGRWFDHGVHLDMFQCFDKGLK